MKSFVIIFALIMSFLSFESKAQSYPVPENYTLKAKEDYAKYEPDIIKTIDWLQQTPWGDQPERKKANAFVVAWLTGSPAVSLTINSDILMQYCNKNGELLMSYIGGYVKYALQHKSDFTVIQGDVEGVKAMIEKYNSDPGRIKDDKMEKLTKIDKDGKLEAWVKSDFEKKK